MKRERVLILGAAGRDFHNFNVMFRDNPDYDVVAFTATQIPKIGGRRYPAELAGDLYPDGIPILPEEEMEKLVDELRADQVVLSYSDLNHETVGHLAARAMAAGADFRILGPTNTMLKSTRPVISICAVRTGCGKSQTTRYVSQVLMDHGLKVVAVRHPMPYGDLAAMAVQRFSKLDDMDRHKCTIEEREEYEYHIDHGIVVYAGVDYAAIMTQAEQEADVIIWDGGNNDWSFYVPDLEIVVADPLRQGHEMRYFPGETNFRRGDVLVLNKADSAKKEDIDTLRERAAELNPAAEVVTTDSVVEVDKPELLKGKRALVIDDGPTLTHGEMGYGAGQVAADKYGASEVIDPRPFAVGSIAELYEKYPHLGKVVPAMGYYFKQLEELKQTIDKSECDVVVVATPFHLQRLFEIGKPSVKVSYRSADRGEPSIRQIVERFLDKKGLK
jgi:predicted GTPase